MQRTVNSDYYFNHQKKVQQVDEMLGTNSVPVDMNGAYVCEEKPDLMDTSNLKEVEANIQERFSLEGDVSQDY